MQFLAYATRLTNNFYANQGCESQEWGSLRKPEPGEGTPLADASHTRRAGAVWRVRGAASARGPRTARCVSHVWPQLPAMPAASRGERGPRPAAAKSSLLFTHKLQSRPRAAAFRHQRVGQRRWRWRLLQALPTQGSPSPSSSSHVPRAVTAPRGRATPSG